MTHLFYIVANDANGDDLSAFVEAHDMAQAVELWEAWSRNLTTNEPDDGFKVFQLPALTGTPHALNWHDPEGVQELDT